ncbi:SMP-30/gluconolactonase/LRE family protein [Pontiella sulfatireligans]|uniref:Gluconolactonase n=1 Tax=Pontiella sulfatireligans TaxID=2750658 RepID=A0A6C2UFR0_9BACT|nr:SMP-30/gluconolactonase/LRE family protein [Pontiella sulfatireligans]VGO18214.1 Gluconolactonase [Pontiella sulfatireligans]
MKNKDSWRIAFGIWLCLGCSLVESMAEEPSVVPAGSRLELLFDGADAFTEGPAVSPDGTLYFSDITWSHRGLNMAGHIWCYDFRTKEARIFRSPSGQANGMAFDAHGNLVIAEGADFGGRRIVRTDLNTGRSVILAATFNGLPFNAPNDLAIDKQGRIYFSDPSFGRQMAFEPIYQPVQGVYRIDPDGKISLIIVNAVKPNGVMVSPDQKTLYVASVDNGAVGGGVGGWEKRTVPHAILAYDLDENGEVEYRGEFAACQADGMAVDIKGNVYAALHGDGKVAIFSPSGEELATIAVPDKPTNVTFGRGPNSRMLYITSGKCVYQIEVSYPGFAL